MYIRLDECIQYDERYNKQSTEYEKHFYGISYKKHFWNKWKKLNIPDNDNSFENVMLVYNLLIELYDINGWKQSKHISKRTYNKYTFNNFHINDIK